ncbi:MAG: type VI secretion system-associated FHA domain protein TagH [Steroidobacteraceae bacterium]
MTLRLRVVSDQRRSLGDRGSIVFTVDGGTIGRSADNDWVLPDPLRYVSAHHARVEFRNGRFYLQDVSTNGVFVNDDTEPLARRGPEGYALCNGDVVRVGAYQIVVALEADVEQPHQDAAAAVPTSIHALHTLGRAAQTDIGAMLNLEDLLVADSPTGEALLPVNAYGQAVMQAPARALAAAPRPIPNTDPDEDSLARRVERLAKAARRDIKNGAHGASAPNGAQLFDVNTGLQVFCRGAGIDADRLPADAQTRFLHLAGQLFREALVGLKDLDRSRGDSRNRFRIELPPPEPDDPRPSLSRSTVEDLLLGLLMQHETRSLDAVQWLRETVTEAKTHELATAQATRAAFVEFLDRLDPAELEARFERAARRGKARSADKAQYWDLFTTFYRNLIEMPADHLPHTFVEAFAAAYREYLKKAAEKS